MPVTKYADQIIELKDRMQLLENDMTNLEKLTPREKNQAIRLECLRYASAGQRNPGRRALKWAKRFYEWVLV
jgi:hypothetical protein